MWLSYHLAVRCNSHHKGDIRHLITLLQLFRYPGLMGGISPEVMFYRDTIIETIRRPFEEVLVDMTPTSTCRSVCITMTLAGAYLLTDPTQLNWVSTIKH